jgi:ABC-type multidrug transport system fused ATPase/permease subunit
MSILAGIALISAWMQITLIAWYSEGMARSIGRNYFKLCMMKDGHFFDKAQPDKISRKLQSELKLVRRIGEHWAYAFQSGFAFIGSFAVAFWQGWLFTCVLLPGVPVIVCTGIILTIALNSRARQAAKSYV